VIIVGLLVCGSLLEQTEQGVVGCLHALVLSGPVLVEQQAAWDTRPSPRWRRPTS
jgi:hypothetical protein